MKRIFPVASVIVVLIWAQSAIADPSVKDLAARTELHPIETLTLSVRQFLTGDKNGKALYNCRSLAISSRCHEQNAGCSTPTWLRRLECRDEYWAKTFNEMGIASFLVDSFSGRGSAVLP